MQAVVPLELVDGVDRFVMVHRAQLAVEAPKSINRDTGLKADVSVEILGWPEAAEVSVWSCSG